MDKISEAILKYRCCICKSPLSVAPIMTANVSNSTEELYKCGRCKDFKYRPTSQSAYSYSHAPETFYRASLYENVAPHLSFPCRYNECREKIQWSKVKTHETNCPHRTICCPLFDSNCSKVVKMKELVQHFKTTHSSSIKRVGTPIEVSHQYNGVFLLMLEDGYFIVYILNGDRIAVLSPHSNEYTQFNLKIVSLTYKNFSVMFDSLPIISFEENSHCFMCVSQKCGQAHHPFSKQNRQSQMDLNSFTSKLGNNFFNLHNGSNIRFSITPIPNKVEVPKKVNQVGSQAGATTKSEEVNIQKAVKKALSCPCCFMYMATTIYSCAIGHSFCAKCKTRLQTCPLCRTPLDDGRNFVLEELAAQVDLPCTNHGLGCTFVGKTPAVCNHVEVCIYNSC